MKRLSIKIVDKDNQFGCDAMEKLVSLKKVNIKCFTTLKTFIDSYKKNGADVVFLSSDLLDQENFDQGVSYDEIVSLKNKSNQSSTFVLIDENDKKEYALSNLLEISDDLFIKSKFVYKLMALTIIDKKRMYNI